MDGYTTASTPKEKILKTLLLYFYNYLLSNISLKKKKKYQNNVETV